MKMNDNEKMAFDYTNGVIKAINKKLWYVLIIVVIIIIMRNWSGSGVDSTDKSGWNRSGITLHTDVKTGLQYLSGDNGGLTPRLDKQGKHMKEN